MARKTSLMRVDDLFKRAAEQIRRDLETERNQSVTLVDASVEIADFLERAFGRRRR